MLLQAFLKGVSLAFYIVVPIGALSVLYIKRTIQKGFFSGFFSSLGVTSGECIYASAAIYGLSFISNFLLEWKILLQSLGVVMMLIIGLRAILSQTKISNQVEVRNTANGLFGDYISMLIITLFNPLTIFGFIAVFTSFGANNFEHVFAIQLMMLLGFFTMSFSYCMLLISISIYIKNKLKSDDSKLASDVELISMLNKISGIVIILFTMLSFLISIINN